LTRPALAALPPLLAALLLAATAGAATITGVPNLDDDDVDGRPDREQGCAAALDNDREPLRFASAPTSVSLEGARDVRVCADGAPVLGAGVEATVWRPPAGTTEASVEFLAPGARGTLRVDGIPIELRTAPILLPSALQPAWRVWVTAPDLASDAEIRLAGGLHAVLGRRLSFVEDSPDQWVQDHVELASARGDSSDLGLALLHRDADALRLLLEAEPDVVELPGLAWHQFGDLEATPPLGPAAPQGAILTSSNRHDPGRERLVAFFVEQGAQPIVRLDTGFLAVGHVDEIVAFVPDPSAPRGFRALVPDPRAGLQLLDRLPPHHRLPHLVDRPTAGRLAADAELRRYNEELADGPLRALREALVQALALEPGEIVGLPMLYRSDWDGDEALAAALTTNPVNLLLVDDDAGAPVVFLPDPGFRPPGASADDDPFVQAWRERLPATLRVELLDDWRSYHELGGELHCATGVWREPLSPRRDRTPPAAKPASAVPDRSARPPPRPTHALRAAPPPGRSPAG
jgi:hypothetical protein